MREILPVFDFDDTVVVGSTPMYNYCHQKAFESIGITLYEGAIRDFTEARWGARHEVHIRYILTSFPELIPSKNYNLEDLVNQVSDVYMENLEKVFAASVRPLQGTAEELGKLTVRPALASGIHPDILPKVLKNSGIKEDFFEPVITAYDIPPDRSKPDPYMLHKVVEYRRSLTGAKDEFRDVAVVGDSVNDMRMAYAVGATAIAVCSGRMERPDAERRMKNNGGIIDYVRNDIREVPSLINQMNEIRLTSSDGAAGKRT